MLFKRAFIFLTFVYFLTAGITWVAGEAGDGAEGRVTMADIVALALIGIFVISKVFRNKNPLRLPQEFVSYLPLLVVFGFGVAFAVYPLRGLLELLIHVFIFLVAIALYNMYVQMPREEAAKILLKMVLYTGALLAVVGLVNFLMWPSLIPGELGGLRGTFRNTGQAGSFFGMYLAIVLPAFFTGQIRRSLLNAGALTLIAVALLFTFKRAASAGALVGILLLALSMGLSSSKRDKRFGISVLAFFILATPVGYLLFQWALSNVHGMDYWFHHKFNNEAVENFSSGFLEDNISAATRAFEMNPLIGVGLANVIGVVTAKYEIHSTYLAIIGVSGLLGVLGYLFFMAIFVLRIISGMDRNPYGLYLRYFFPMLVGLAISWGYTYHLRKREFWIMFFIVVLMRSFSVTERRELKMGAIDSGNPDA
ncbi:hypothetical protein ASD55_03880 [Rhodanobacter sp. Root561]|nr:hypothetical protein ASD55_03880 [Rhodanobacter sp. Root561]